MSGPNPFAAPLLHVSVDRQSRLRLELEERVVQHSVVDVDFAHLRLHALLHPLPQALVRVVRALAHLCDAGRLDKVRQLEWRLVEAALVLQELALLAPVLGHRHRVAHALQPHQKQRVLCCYVPAFHNVWPPHDLLQLGDLHPVQKPPFLLRKCLRARSILHVVSLVLFFENIHALLFLVPVVAVPGVAPPSAVGKRVLEVFKNVLELSQVLQRKDKRVGLRRTKQNEEGESDYPTGERGLVVRINVFYFYVGSWKACL